MFMVQDLRFSQWFYWGFRTSCDNDTVLLDKWFVMWIDVMPPSSRVKHLKKVVHWTSCKGVMKLSLCWRQCSWLQTLEDHISNICCHWRCSDLHCHLSSVEATVIQ